MIRTVVKPQVQTPVPSKIRRRRLKSIKIVLQGKKN
jgi:hypothetical protein